MYLHDIIAAMLQYSRCLYLLILKLEIFAGEYFNYCNDTRLLKGDSAVCMVPSTLSSGVGSGKKILWLQRSPICSSGEW